MYNMSFPLIATTCNWCVDALSVACMNVELSDAAKLSARISVKYAYLRENVWHTLHLKRNESSIPDMPILQIFTVNLGMIAEDVVLLVIFIFMHIYSICCDI